MPPGQVPQLQPQTHKHTHGSSSRQQQRQSTSQQGLCEWCYRHGPTQCESIIVYEVRTGQIMLEVSSTVLGSCHMLRTEAFLMSSLHPSAVLPVSGCRGLAVYCCS